MPNITTAGNASSNKMEATPSMTNVNAWKPFTSVVLEKQVEPVKDNAKEHLNSPYIGLFSVPDEYEDSEPSCGAFITRV